MLITREHGSWVVLGTLVTDVAIDATAPLDLDCGRCTLCIDACPTGLSTSPESSTRTAASRTGRRHLTRCQRTTARSRRSVYGCDICQDVCPWNRGVEKRRAEDELPDDTVPNVALVDWLTGSGTDLVEEFDRLYVPRNDPRWLQRNALYALANTGDSDSLALLEPYRASDTRFSPTRPRGRDPDCRAGVMSPTRLNVLAHELRSPVAALAAIAEAFPGADDATRRRLVELAGTAGASVERLLADAAAPQPSGSNASTWAAWHATAPRRPPSVAYGSSPRSTGAGRRRRSGQASSGARQPDRQRGRSLTRRGDGHGDRATRGRPVEIAVADRGTESTRPTSTASSSRECA